MKSRRKNRLITQSMNKHCRHKSPTRNNKTIRKVTIQVKKASTALISICGRKSKTRWTHMPNTSKGKWLAPYHPTCKIKSWMASRSQRDNSSCKPSNKLSRRKSHRQQLVQSTGWMPRISAITWRLWSWKSLIQKLEAKSIPRCSTTVSRRSLNLSKKMSNPHSKNSRSRRSSDPQSKNSRCSISSVPVCSPNRTIGWAISMGARTCMLEASHLHSPNLICIRRL